MSERNNSHAMAQGDYPHDEAVRNNSRALAPTGAEAPLSVRAYLVCSFAAFGGIFFGYDIGWMSGVLAMPYFIAMYTGVPYDYAEGGPVDPQQEFAIGSSEKSLMTSILSLGTFFGALVAGDLADIIGRRITIMIGCGVFSAGVVLQVASTSQLGLMCVGRLLAGFGVGFESAIVILYTSEIAPKKIRGAIVAGYQMAITIGLLLANCLVYATQNRADSGSYRIPIAIQFLWAILLAGGLAFLPESPRFLVKKGAIAKATKALSFVRGYPEDSSYIQEELAEIIANYELERQLIPQTSYVGSWLACFKGPLAKPSSNIRRTILGAAMQGTQQMTGINFIFYFGTTFFQQLGTIDNPFLISLITSLVNVFVTPIAFWTVERFGRRALLLWGGLGMITMYIIVGAVGITSASAEANNPTAVKAMIAFVCFTVAVYATTWGPVAWIIIGEAFPLPIRARGVAISTASCWFWNCVIAVISPYMTGDEDGAVNLGPKVFFVWAGFCLCGTTFAYFLVPEMKGLSLEQIDRMLEQTTPRKSLGWRPDTNPVIAMEYLPKHDKAYTKGDE